MLPFDNQLNIINVGMSQSNTRPKPCLLFCNTGRQLAQCSEIILCHSDWPMWLVGDFHVAKKC